MSGLLDSMPGTPSAISQMLGLLMQHPAAGQPGQPAPSPVAPTPVPPQGDPQQQAQPEPPQSLLGKIHDFISDHVGIKEPGGYRGLLSPDEIRQAKPGILASGAGDSWSENLNKLLAVKGATLQAQEHGRIMQARQKMGELFPEQPNETHTDRMNRLERMYAYSLQNGDETMADKLKGVVAELAIPQKVAAPQPPHTLNTSKGIMEWDEKSGKYMPTGFQAPERAEPTPQIISAATPNADGTAGTPTFFRVPKDGGPASPIAGIVPQPGSRAQNAQNMAAEALLRSSVSEMTNADAFMRSYENDLKNKTASINGLAQFLGGVGNSFTHDDPASRAIQNSALTVLNHVNPNLARYIRRGLSFAEGEAGISKRPSDFRTKMAAFLSTAASGAPNDMIDDIQGRRSSILNPLHSVLEEHTPASSTGTKTKLTQAQYEAGLKKHSDAEIATHYDLSGVRRKK